MDQFDFPSVFVLYRYKASSQQLFDYWKDKRMTGFRFSWRVKNENPPLIASSSELGRSIQTPNLSDTVDQVYKAILKPPTKLLE